MICKTYAVTVKDNSKKGETPFIYDLQFRGAFTAYYQAKYKRWEKKEMKRLVRSGKAKSMSDKFALLNYYNECECAIHLAFLGKNNFSCIQIRRNSSGNTEHHYETTTLMPIVIIQQFLWLRDKYVQ